MTDRELFKMALNCLLAWEKESSGHGWSLADQECVDAIRARLAEDEITPDGYYKVAAWIKEKP